MENQLFSAAFKEGLKEERESIRQRETALREKGCEDDAVLERIRMNICDAFLAVAGAADGQADLKAYREFCEKRFRTISDVWRRNLENAIRHEDFRAQAVEETKIDQAERIQRLFEKIGGAEA